eukprot:97662_1
MSYCNNHIFNLSTVEESYLSFDKTVSTKATKRKRKCTDIGCCLLFILLLIGDIVILAIALSKDPSPNKQYLFKGHDYNGKICPEWTAWINVSHPQLTECVNNCQQVITYIAEPFEDHWCVPNKTLRNKTNFKFSDASASYLRVIGDLQTLYPQVLIVSIVGSLLTSYIYLYMISINKRLFAYRIMNIMFALPAAIILIYHGVKDVTNDLTDNTGGIEVFFGVFILCLVLMIAYYFYYDREALETEIEMMAESIQALIKLWSVIVFCFIYSLFILAFIFGFWIHTALTIYSIPLIHHHNIPPVLSDTITTPSGKYVEIIISNYKYLIIYHIIFAIYLLFMFCYFGYLVLSHVVLVWYLGKNNESYCGCCKSKQIIPKIKDMNNKQLQTWIDDIRREFPQEFDIKQLKNVIKQHNTTGKDIINGYVYYKILIEWLQELEPKLSDNVNIELVSDIFFKLVRKRQQLENKKPSQSSIVWDAFTTITWYHIGTASFAALLAVFGIFDFYPKIKSIKCFRNNKNKDANNRINDSFSPKPNKYHSIEMTTFDKTLMYNDYREKIFPLIKEKILNLSKEYMLKAVVDKTIENITKKHYYSAHGTDESKYDTYESENKTDKNVAQHIISVITNNINDFKYENEIKEDIEKIIDKEIEKLKQQLCRKKEEKEKRKIAETDDRSEIISVEITNNSKYNRMRKEGLIFTSLYGTSFCLSSYGASKLEKDNITRLADVEGFSNYNERFGRIGIASVNTSIVVIIMFILDYINGNISSFIMPSLIVWMVSYIIGSIFTMILEVTVSTLLFCVILNEEKWKELFSINQGKIKQDISGLANGLAAMITQHQLIMQLKEPEVDKKIFNMIKNYVSPNKDDKNLTKAEILNIETLSKRLFDTKKKALITEKKLLEQIDGTMKLTQYLIDVILVENYFNKQYKNDKYEQEIGRESIEYIFKKEKYDSVSRKKIKQDLYDVVLRYPTIKSFLYFYPISGDEKKNQINTWKRTVKSLENKFKENGIINFKMTGAKKKGIGRAFYKSFYSYHNQQDGFRYLTDVLRCSFVFSDFINLYAAFECIYGMNNKFEILRVKDRFNTVSEACGYRDFMINILIKNEKYIEGIICEIQLHHKTFYNAKRISHKMYKKTRLFETDNGNEAYKYAVKYVRPVIGRFKVYPMDQEEEKIDILQIIAKKIEKLAIQYCKEVVIEKLDKDKADIIKREYRMSILAALPAVDADTNKNDEQHLIGVPENQQIKEEEKEYRE